MIGKKNLNDRKKNLLSKQDKKKKLQVRKLFSFRDTKVEIVGKTIIIKTRFIRKKIMEIFEDDS